MNRRNEFETCEIINFLEHVDMYRLLFEFELEYRRTSGGSPGSINVRFIKILSDAY
jgi:hypothetical protein